MSQGPFNPDGNPNGNPDGNPNGNPYGNPYGAPLPTNNPYAPPGQGGMPYGAPPQAPPPGSALDYELDEEENKVIANTALWARVLGGVTIGQGVLQMRNFSFGALIGLALSLAVGGLLFGAATSFSAVVKTQGNDVVNLMQAIDKLGTVLRFRVILTMIVVVLGLVAMVCVIGVGATSVLAKH
jgi:hypothetical protein